MNFVTSASIRSAGQSRAVAPDESAGDQNRAVGHQGSGMLIARHEQVARGGNEGGGYRIEYFCRGKGLRRRSATLSPRRRGHSRPAGAPGGGALFWFEIPQ